MSRQIQAGSTGQIVYVNILSTLTSLGLASLVYNSSGLTAYYVLNGAASVAITLATQTPAAAYSSGGFCAVDNTNAPGLYRLDLPTGATATGPNVTVVLQGAANMADCKMEFPLVAYNPNDAVHLGLSAIPNAAAAAAGGLPTNGTGSGQIGLDGSGNVSLSSSALTAIWAVTTRTLTSLSGLVVGTVTNLTNAPTSGDFTSTMKTSITAAVPTAAAIATAAAADILVSPTQLLATDASGNVGLSSSALSAIWAVATRTLTTLSGLVVGTVTNLTNAPTNGDLTATMKASVTTAATAATPTAAAVTGAVGSVTGGVGGNVTGSVGSVSGVTFPTGLIASQLDITSQTTTLVADISAGTASTATAISSGTTAVNAHTDTQTTTLETNLASAANLVTANSGISSIETTVSTINTATAAIETVTNKFNFTGSGAGATVNANASISGTPNVNVESINGVPTTEVTTVNDNWGTTSPILFTDGLVESSASVVLTQDQLDEIAAAVVAELGTVAVITIPAVANGGVITLTQSFDWTTQDSRAITVTVSGLPVLNEACSLEQAPSASFVPIIGTAQLQSAGTYLFTFNVTQAILSGIPVTTTSGVNVRIRAIGPGSTQVLVANLKLVVTP